MSIIDAAPQELVGSQYPVYFQDERHTFASLDPSLERLPRPDDSLLANFGRNPNLVQTEAITRLWQIASATDFDYAAPAITNVYARVRGNLSMEDKKIYLALVRDRFKNSYRATEKRPSSIPTSIGTLASRVAQTEIEPHQSQTDQSPNTFPKPVEINKNNDRKKRILIAAASAAVFASGIFAGYLSYRGFLNVPDHSSAVENIINGSVLPPKIIHTPIVPPSLNLKHHAAHAMPKYLHLKNIKPTETVWEALHNAGMKAKNIMGNVMSAVRKSNLPYHLSGHGTNQQLSVNGETTGHGILQEIGRFLPMRLRK